MVRHHGKFVSYLRVSTKRQGDSGLGLEAQRAAVETWLNGGSWQLVEEHVEVESGKHDDNRPALAKALRGLPGLQREAGHCQARPSQPRRALPAWLAEGRRRVHCRRHAARQRLTVGIMALVAEQEREAISQRTKAALAAAKARGVRLGNPKGTRCRAPRPAARAARQRPMRRTRKSLPSVCVRCSPSLMDCRPTLRPPSSIAAVMRPRAVASGRLVLS